MFNGQAASLVFYEISLCQFQGGEALVSEINDIVAAEPSSALHLIQHIRLQAENDLDLIAVDQLKSCAGRERL
jgi:hypothetical protein